MKNQFRFNWLFIFILPFLFTSCTKVDSVTFTPPHSCGCSTPNIVVRTTNAQRVSVTGVINETHSVNAEGVATFSLPNQVCGDITLTFRAIKNMDTSDPFPATFHVTQPLGSETVTLLFSPISCAGTGHFSGWHPDFIPTTFDPSMIIQSISPVIGDDDGAFLSAPTIGTRFSGAFFNIMYTDSHRFDCPDPIVSTTSDTTPVRDNRVYQSAAPLMVNVTGRCPQ